MRAHPFLKMSGAGNDFVVLDNRKGAVAGDLNAFAAAVADRRRGVGADGVLLLEPSAARHFRMRYFNADGSEAEMCGNGGRCIARFALLAGAAPELMRFEKLAGDFEAQVLPDGRVELRMTDAKGLRLGLEIPVGGSLVRAHGVDTGVPHLVVPVEDLAGTDVVGLGRALRHHPAFAPKGTNVNFMRVTGADALAVRTYERGVEDETLACGTGSVAAAVVAAALGGGGAARRDLAVSTAGGDVLRVAFTPTRDGATGVTLTGPAEVTFEGSLDLDRYLKGGTPPR